MFLKINYQRCWKSESRNHKAARRVSHHDDSLRACFLALYCCVFRLFGVHPYALYGNVYQNWIMGVSVFHSDYCDIRDSKTRAAHCFSGFDLHLRFVCWLQMYTVAKHTVSVAKYIFLISVGDWLYFSGHGWRPLQISFESRCLWASCFRFSQMATRLCIKRPKMDLTFFKSCTLHLKHFEKIFSWRYQIMEHRYIELDTHWQKLLSRLLCGYSLCRQHSCHSIECNGEVCFSFGFSKTQVQANSIHIWESAFQSSI